MYQSARITRIVLPGRKSLEGVSSKQGANERRYARVYHPIDSTSKYAQHVDATPNCLSYKLTDWRLCADSKLHPSFTQRDTFATLQSH